MFERFPIEEKVIDGIPISIPADLKKLTSETSQSQFTGCNLSNAQAYYGKYGRDVSQDAVLFKKKALEVLSTAINTLDRLGVRFWLSSGTCLGKKSHGRFNETKMSSTAKIFRPIPFNYSLKTFFLTCSLVYFLPFPCLSFNFLHVSFSDICSFSNPPFFVLFVTFVAYELTLKLLRSR